MKKLLAFLLILSLVLLAACAPKSDISYDPSNFPGTKWATHDNGIRFNVKTDETLRFYAPEINSNGEVSLLRYLYTSIFAEICTEADVYTCFVVSYFQDYRMVFYSQEMPSTMGTESFSDILAEYTLIEGRVVYKSDKHFVLKVDNSKIGEVPRGTTLEFYRSDYN